MPPPIPPPMPPAPPRPPRWRPPPWWPCSRSPPPRGPRSGSASTRSSCDCNSSMIWARCLSLRASLTVSHNSRSCWSSAALAAASASMAGLSSRRSGVPLPSRDLRAACSFSRRDRRVRSSAWALPDTCCHSVCWLDVSASASLMLSAPIINCSACRSIALTAWAVEGSRAVAQQAANRAHARRDRIGFVIASRSEVKEGPR